MENQIKDFHRVNPPENRIMPKFLKTLLFFCCLLVGVSLFFLFLNKKGLDKIRIDAILKADSLNSVCKNPDTIHDSVLIPLYKDTIFYQIYQYHTDTISLCTEQAYLYHKQRCIINLMLSESFSEKIYNCGAGYPTIGFGHQITKRDKGLKRVNFTQAYIMLESDFNGCIALARELGYEYDNCQQLAIAHAIFCMGAEKVMRIKDFKSSIGKYCYYKANAQFVRSEWILKSRLFEKDLYLTN